MQTIHSMCRYRHPVWAVSHAGHCAPPDSMDMLQGKTPFDPFIWNSVTVEHHQSLSMKIHPLNNNTL